jgi:hypothetical protein
MFKPRYAKREHARSVPVLHNNGQVAAAVAYLNSYYSREKFVLDQRPGTDTNVCGECGIECVGGVYIRTLKSPVGVETLDLQILETYCVGCGVATGIPESYRINLYSDYIYKNKFPEHVPTERSVAVRFSKPFPTDIVPGFVIVGLTDSWAVYANDVARLKCPPLTGLSVAEGSLVVTLVVDAGVVQSAIFVKAIDKKLITNPEGCKADPTETFEDCAARELEEETGIANDMRTDLVLIEEQWGVMKIYDMDWSRFTKCYYTTIIPSRLDQILTHSDDEIEYVRAIPYQCLVNGDSGCEIEPRQTNIVLLAAKHLFGE